MPQSPATIPPPSLMSYLFLVETALLPKLDIDSRFHSVYGLNASGAYTFSEKQAPANPLPSWGLGAPTQQPQQPVPTAQIAVTYDQLVLTRALPEVESAITAWCIAAFEKGHYL